MSNILNVDISEIVRASAKIHRTTFVDLDICQRMLQWRKLHLIILTYFFKIKIIKIIIPPKQLELAQICEMTSGVLAIF